MKDPREPGRYEEMTEEERIEASDKAAVFEWLEGQTKGTSPKRKKQKLKNFRFAFEEWIERLTYTDGTR